MNFNMNDNKANQICDIFIKKFETSSFDEIDIIGFLIFIRELLKDRKNDFKYLIELADFIAHRKRNKGIILNSINYAKNNNYYTDSNKSIKGCDSIQVTDWNNELNKLWTLFHIKTYNKLNQEFTLCIYSLMQDACFEKNNKIIGKTWLDFYKRDNQIALLTSNNTANSTYICFAYYDGYKILCDDELFPSTNRIFHTERENKELVLKDSNNVICVTIK